MLELVSSERYYTICANRKRSVPADMDRVASDVLFHADVADTRWKVIELLLSQRSTLFYIRNNVWKYTVKEHMFDKCVLFCVA